MFYEKIVAIDDDPKALESLRLILQDSYEVICFNGGVKALEYLRQSNTVRLVFSDVVMKEMDGISILREIKKISRDILVVIMSAYGSKEVVVQALQGEADDFVDKPFNIQELRVKVRELLRTKARPALEGGEPFCRMKFFVEKNFASASLQGIAGEMCLSEKYVSRLFKQKHGLNYREFKIHVKITRAKELLTNSDMPVHYIAEELGYQNAETFIRLFKRKTGQTPLEYRNHGKGAA